MRKSIHYTKAESYLAIAEEKFSTSDDPEEINLILRMAQVHATLAQGKDQ